MADSETSSVGSVATVDLASNEDQKGQSHSSSGPSSANTQPTPFRLARSTAIRSDEAMPDKMQPSHQEEATRTNGERSQVRHSRAAIERVPGRIP